MEWSKLKNIIILILLAANLFLLLMAGTQERSAAQYQEQAIEDAVAALERNGIRLERSLVPGKAELPLLSVTRDRQNEAELAAALLGDCSVSDLGGGRYLYESPSGQAEFRSNGNFHFAFSSNVYSVAPGENMTVHAQDIMERIGFAGMQVAREDQNGQISLSLRQTYQNLPVFSCQVTLEYQGNQLRTISGQRLMGTPASVSGSDPITISTALLRILNGITGLGDICSEITDITPGYQLSISADTAQMIPMWRVTTDTGTYTLNTLTGSLDRA